MRFTDLFIRRPILSVVVSLLILLVGGASMAMLNVREYPNMESATIMVTTSYPGATQEVMQGFVTTPISQAIATANGIEYLTSSSSQSMSTVSAKLKLNANADRSMTEILAKVQQVKYQLPPGATDPVITKFTDGVGAIQYITFQSDTMSIPQLTDFATRVAQPLITAVPGVGQVEMGGQQVLAMRVWLDPDKLTARGITAGEISDALRANNVQSAPGQLKGSRTVINITASTDLRNLDDFRQMVIKSTDDGIVRLSDVATVEIGGQNYDSMATSSGKRSVFIAISPTPDGNPLQIVKAVEALLPGIERVAPPGTKVFNQFDTAHFVNASIDEVTSTLVEAVAIVVIVIFLFLGTVRAVVIPVVTIPLSLVGTAALMLAFGFSINLLTLLAMVLAIGLVVDDAIVVVENIHRHIEEGLPPIQAALVGAREIVTPVIAMTITLAAVYTPIGLMGGLTGALFREFAFTLAGAVIVSGVIALTLSPMMSSFLLTDHQSEGRLSRTIEGYMHRLQGTYSKLLGKALGARGAVLLAGAAVLVGIVILFTGAPRELAPEEDQGVIFVQIKGPQYANVDYTARYTGEMDRIFHGQGEYQSSWFGTGTDGPSGGFGGIILKDWKDRDRSAAQVQAELNQKASGLTGVFAAAFQPPSLPAGSGGMPVQMVIRSSAGFHEIYQAMEAIKGAAWGSGHFAFVDSDLAFDNPEAHITIDRAKAGEMGVTMDAIAGTLATLVGENYVNRFNYFDRSYDVIAQVPQDRRLTPDSIGRFYVKARSGELVPLSTVVKVDMRPQANRLPQFNQMNSATLSAILAPGATMGQAVDFLEKQPLPPGFQVDWLSDSRQYVYEGNRLTVSFGFALIVIFLVLAAQFESFRDPLVILVTVPLAVCGALIPLYLGFATLNIYTQIGLVTLIGLISKHGILMVSFANEMQHEEGLDRIEAIRKAAAVRMRPVLMTTAAMVAGLIPLIFANGAGASSRFAIGIVVVMGMLVGTLFTLFVLPTVYSFIARDHRAAADSERAKVLVEPEAPPMRKPAVLLLSLLASACAVGPDYHRPQSPAPAAGAFQTAAPGISMAPAADNWWRLYDDPALDQLIERALAANTDLRVARANLLRAQNVVREARAGLLPLGQTTASAEYGNSQGSGGSRVNNEGGNGSAQWSFNGGIDLQWELDLFGRIGRTIEAARADAEATEAVRDRVALTVAAETARSYVDACALAESIAVAKDSAGIAGRQLTLIEQRERAGAASRLDSERSATALANVRADLPTLEGRRRAALFELAALLGATPAEVPEAAQRCARAPRVIQPIPVGDGQALLARRPDVREAERKLAADTARIGVATADLYPRISLGGSGNFFRNDQVRGGDSFTFGVGPLLSWSFPSLAVGRARIAQLEATTQASLATFDGTVMTALKEVEQALSYYAAEGERNARLREAASHADAAFKLADRRYRAGSIGLIEQLDAQRDLTSARSALASSDQQLGSLRVDLFKALGGGWAQAQAAAPARP